jgi:hypothetical protein
VWKVYWLSVNATEGGAAYRSRPGDAAADVDIGSLYRHIAGMPAIRWPRVQEPVGRSGKLALAAILPRLVAVFPALLLVFPAFLPVLPALLPVLLALLPVFPDLLPDLLAPA